MREICHLQAGQCGNQIGAKVIQYNYYIRPEFRLTSNKHTNNLIYYHEHKKLYKYYTLRLLI